MNRLLLTVALGMMIGCSFNSQGQEDTPPPGNAPPIPIIPFDGDAGIAKVGDGGSDAKTLPANDQDAGSPHSSRRGCHCCDRCVGFWTPLTLSLPPIKTKIEVWWQRTDN